MVVEAPPDIGDGCVIQTGIAVPLVDAAFELVLLFADETAFGREGDDLNLEVSGVSTSSHFSMG